MINLHELTRYTNQLLNIDNFQDYCPNGLQVEGRREVRKLVSGVTASQALVDAAIAAGADALLVHHGYFWKGEDPCVTGMKRRRLASLLGADISLLAYHLPLDAHPELGNNAQLGALLNIPVEGWFGSGRGPGIGPDIACYGTLPQAWAAAAFETHIAAVLGRAPQFIAGGEHKIRRVGWCTGAAQSYIDAAAALGLDAFISGEISEPTVHVAREAGIHFFAAGHHATERYGVQALAAHLSTHFGLEHEFLDLDNPA
ncbi:MAG: Nif3-like dinuclear metal center hexameric protein [Gammaproteobacteria bacterium]|nr:Nif3-like dinuclear metal center hexameric protein [Gammaproteobacteria bacterium]MBU2479433.1 Nif3-like dinuclear metal center hexameric protein [Gammaproteobacteria bacterium]